MALPTGDPQSFNFTPSNGAPFGLTNTAPAHNSGPLLMGVCSVAESVPSGWMQTGAVCSDGSPVSAIDLSPGDVAVDYATQDVSASAGSNSVAASGTLNIPKTSASGTVSVTINGDTDFEIDETLKLLLSNPKNVVPTTPFGTGTILNDDAPRNPIGEKNLAITTGSIYLSWGTGSTQTAYALLQYNTSTGVPTIINLPGAATSYSDASATNGVVYCYVLAALGPGGAFLGLSDLLCGMAGAESGTVIPQGFSLTLGQSASVTMTRAAPAGGADSYLLERIPLDGAAITNAALPPGTTTTSQAVVAAGTCFQLVAIKGVAFGTSDVLCGVQG